MILGPMVRGVHEDPRRHGSTGTPSHFIGIEDINMDNEFVPIAGIDNPRMICDQHLIGRMVRGVHEDPQRYGSTRTPIVVIDHEDIDEN